MTVREYKDLAAIVAEHQYAYAQILAAESPDISKFDQIKGCIATDERVIREVLRIPPDGVDAWINKACTWYKLHERVGSADIILK